MLKTVFCYRSGLQLHWRMLEMCHVACSPAFCQYNKLCLHQCLPQRLLPALYAGNDHDWAYTYMLDGCYVALQLNINVTNKDAKLRSQEDE